MSKRDNNSSSASSWLGMKLFFIGLLIAAPALLIYILNNHKNSFLGNFSIFIFAIGLVFGCIGIVFHWKTFSILQSKATKGTTEIDEKYTVEQPWD